jgi:uncharacterized protein
MKNKIWFLAATALCIAITGCRSGGSNLLQSANAEASYQEALRFFDGKVVAQSYADAVRLLKTAAADNHLNAMVLLAAMYRSGTGVEKSIVESVRLLERADGLGDIAATVTLATMYDYGQDVPVDRSKAALLYEKAAVKGDRYAQLSLKKIKE